MRRKNKRFPRSSGFILVIAMIAMLAMTFFMITNTNTSLSTIKVSGNYAKTISAFNLAEMGLAKARNMVTNQSFSTILTTYGQNYMISPTSYQSYGTYEVTVADDAKDTDGNALTDNNNIIKVTSTGRSTTGSKVTIETHLQLINSVTPVSFPSAPGSCASASGFCDSAAVLCGSSADVQIQGASNIDGADYDTPPYGCNGSGCNTSSDPSTSGNWDLIGQSTINLSGSATKKENMGAGGSTCNQWQTFWNQWASVSSSAPGVVLIGGSTSSYSTSNSCASPKVFLINTSAATLNITGNTFMCGMFIIASNTTINMNGTVTLNGLILAMGNASNLSYTGTSGTSNMNGKLIFKSTAVDSGKELYVKGNAAIHFSSESVGYALQAINNTNGGGGSSGSGTLITSAWEETY